MAATVITSILTGTANSYSTSAYQFNAVGTDFVTQGVVGTITNTTGVAPSTGAFAVNAQSPAAMYVDVTAGRAWITATPSGQTSQALSIYMASNSTSYAISANASGSTKYDWIYLKVDPTVANAPDASGDNATALYTSRSSSNSTDNGSPPTYGILLAIVTVANGASSIANSAIVDGRPAASLTATSQGWTPVSDSWTYSSGASTNTTVLTVPTDATLKYSVGMKVKFSNNSAVNYGIITKVASTALTIYLGTDYAIANSAISSIYYSDRKAPFGFPLDPTKWTVSFTSTSTASLASGGGQVGDLQVTVPIGSWYINAVWAVNFSRTSANGEITTYISESASATTSGYETTCNTSDVQGTGSAATGGAFTQRVSGFKKTYAAATTIYGYTAGTYTTAALYTSRNQKHIIEAVCAYL